MSQPIASRTSTSRGSKEKVKESFYDEFLILLPSSSQNKKVSDDYFMDDLAYCRDAKTLELIGMCLFSYFYKNRDSVVPVSNPWMSGLAKLIIPEVFLDVDALLMLAQCYDPLSKTIRKDDGSPLVTLDRKSFMRAFRIQIPMAMEIDLKAQANRYVREVVLVSKEIKNHIPKENRNYIVAMPGPIPYAYKDLKFYIKYIAYGIYQVLGVDASPERITSDILMLVMDSQSHLVRKGYDYIGYIINKMHEGLLSLKNFASSSTPKFMHYSLLMHLIAYHNYNLINLQDLKPQMTWKGVPNPVQYWLGIWSPSYPRRDFGAFENWIVYPIL